MSTATRRAWAAGFFDGEGYAGWTPHGGFRVQLAQIEPEPLQRFVEAVGIGKVTKSKSRTKADNPIYNVVYSNKKHFFLIFERLSKYLCQKKTNAFESAILLQETWKAQEHERRSLGKKNASREKNGRFA